jgi:hypothetical protein
MTDNIPHLENDRIYDWAIHMFRPVAMVNRLLDKNYEDKLTETVFKYWLLPIVVSLLINSVILYSFGINVEEHKFLSALTVVLDTVELIAECFILYALLVMVGARPYVGDVFVCYTVIVVFSPVFAILAAPNTYFRIAMLEQIRQQHLSAAASLQYFLDNAANLKKLIDEKINFPGQNILLAAYTILSISLRVVLAESLTQVLVFDRLAKGFALDIPWSWRLREGGE